VGGGDDAGEIFIEELEELELDDPTATDVNRQEHARRFAQERAKASAPSRLAERAPQPMTAKEALQAAMQQERADKERKEAAARRAEEEVLAAKRRVAAEAKAKADAVRQRAAREAREAEEAKEREAADRAAFARLAAPRAPASRPPPRPRAVRRGPMPSSSPTDPMGLMLAEGRIEALLKRMGVKGSVADVFADITPAVVGPLWEANVVRAVHDGDLATATAADHVRSVIKARPTDLVAARVVLGDEEWAAWIDLDDDRILAMLQPAAVYLVGL